MMEGETTSKKKKANDDHGFIDLIFSWSIEDILNEDMYKNKVSSGTIHSFYLMLSIIN